MHEVVHPCNTIYTHFVQAVGYILYLIGQISSALFWMTFLDHTKGLGCAKIAVFYVKVKGHVAPIQSWFICKYVHIYASVLICY